LESSTSLSGSRWHSDARRAVLWALLAAALFAVMNAGIKLYSQHYSTGQILFLRNLLALIPAIVIVALYGGVAILRTKRLGAHVLRSVFGVLSMFCLFASFRYLRLTDALAINFMAPLILTLLSKLLLRDAVGPLKWTAVGLGFCGVLAIVRPGMGVFEVAGLLALLSAVCNALGLLTVRQLGATESAATTLFYFSAASALFTAGFALPGWQPVPIERVPGFLVIGITGGVAQYLTIEALRLARPSIVTPIQYTLLIWVGLLDFVVWAALPDPAAIFGMALILAGGSLILLPASKNSPA
jgi:drug/metabolite transporter (DMT)-like permease